MTLPTCCTHDTCAMHGSSALSLHMLIVSFAQYNRVHAAACAGLQLAQLVQYALPRYFCLLAEFWCVVTSCKWRNCSKQLTMGCCNECKCIAVTALCIVEMLCIASWQSLKVPNCITLSLATCANEADMHRADCLQTVLLMKCLSEAVWVLVLQDTEAFHQSLLHPSAWYKLKDGPSNEDWWHGDKVLSPTLAAVLISKVNMLLTVDTIKVFCVVACHSGQLCYQKQPYEMCVIVCQQVFVEFVLVCWFASRNS